MHFEIAYNGDRIIEINVSTDPSQVVDISEDVVKVMPQAHLAHLCWRSVWCRLSLQSLRSCAGS